MSALVLVLAPMFLFGGAAIIVYGLLTMRKSVVPAPSRTVIQCPACSRKLRVPAGGGRLRVTCPSCRHEFAHGD